MPKEIINNIKLRDIKTEMKKLDKLLHQAVRLGDTDLIILGAEVQKALCCSYSFLYENPRDKVHVAIVVKKDKQKIIDYLENLIERFGLEIYNKWYGGLLEEHYIQRMEDACK